MTKMKKVLTAGITAAVIIALNAEMIYSNTHIDTEQITFSSSILPDSFNGTKIVHISDYHNHGGKYEAKLVSAVREQNPDYIFITGDTADKVFTDADKANELLGDLAEITDCYMVWGNHDLWIKDEERNKIAEFAEKCGIRILENETVRLSCESDNISLSGFSQFSENNWGNNRPADEFDIVLYHYPEEFHYIADTSAGCGNAADLIFTGHAHGGLIWSPFVKGLYAPGQGFFPEFTSGLYEYGDSTMIVSRGVGNSTVSRRFNNPFHLVVCTLEKTADSQG